MFMKKRIIAAAAAAMLATPAAFAGPLGEWTVDGFALFEVWADTNQGGPDTFTDLHVFTLHNITFSSARKIEGGNRFIWAVGQRLRNGNHGGEGALGNREAWAGFEGDTWGQLKFGRFLTKTWQVLDWPYGAPTYQAETFAEVGAQGYWVVTRAARYTSPQFGAVNFEVTYDTGNENSVARADILELYAHVETKAVKLDFAKHTIKNAGLNLGTGIFGNDGTPGITDGTQQDVTFLGARFNIVSGIGGTLAIKKNTWQNDAGVGTTFDTGQPAAFTGSGIAAAEEVTQDMILADVRFSFGKNLLVAGIVKFNEGEADGEGLSDGATSFGVKLEREIGTNTRIYYFARQFNLDDDFRPVSTFPWQFGNLMSWGGDQDSMLRVGFGAQMMY